MTKFTLHIVNDKSDTISGALGISKQRSKELIELANKAFNGHDDTASALKDCTEKCNTSEEIAFILYVYGHATGHMCERAHVHDGLAELLGRVGHLPISDN
jgi:hypothetical protein